MADYKEQLQLDSPLASKELLSIIREIVRNEIKKVAQFNCMLPCKIISADNTARTASIQLLNDTTTTIDDISNKTGEDLIANQEAYVEKINGSNSNIYIAITKG